MILLDMNCQLVEVWLVTDWLIGVLYPLRTGNYSSTLRATSVTALGSFSPGDTAAVVARQVIII
jgi:hypothetical protein